MIADREKVIKELESLRDICNAKSNMAIGNGKIAWAGYANTVDDALELLKGKQPTWRRGKAFCGNCGGCLENKEKNSSDHVTSIRFCKWCGSPVNWTNEQKGVETCS